VRADRTEAVAHRRDFRRSPRALDTANGGDDTDVPCASAQIAGQLQAMRLSSASGSRVMMSRALISIAGVQ